MSVPQKFLVHGQRSNGDRHLYASRTRFIPAALLECFQCRDWPPVTVTDVAARVARTPVDLKERVRRTWG
jgi:DNA helicase II / ATP-dependent DNA helicase PcrA